MNEPCRNVGCNEQRDGRCTGVACGGADAPSKPIPEARYMCSRCGIHWPANDMYWSRFENMWMCADCICGRSFARGTTLADEIKRQEPEMIDSSITPYILSHWDRARIVAHAKHLLGDACQECTAACTATEKGV